MDFFFQVKKWAGEPVNAEPEKCDELRWVGLDDLPENTVPYMRQAILNFAAGIFFEEFGWKLPEPSQNYPLKNCMFAFCSEALCKSTRQEPEMAYGSAVGWKIDV